MFTTIMMLVLFGLASWIITTILVEGVIFEDVRKWVQLQQDKADSRIMGLSFPPTEADRKKAADALMEMTLSGKTLTDVFGKPSRSALLRSWFWHKMRYLVGCHLCTGTWVSMVLALFLPAIVSPAFFGWAINAMIIKAVGHLVLAAVNMANAKIDLLKAQTESAKNNDAGGSAGKLSQELASMMMGATTRAPRPRSGGFDDLGGGSFGGRF